MDPTAVIGGLQGRRNRGRAGGIHSEHPRCGGRREEILRLVAAGEAEIHHRLSRRQVESESRAEDAAVLEIAEPRIGVRGPEPEHRRRGRFGKRQLVRVIGVDHESPAGIEMPEKLGLGIDDA